MKSIENYIKFISVIAILFISQELYCQQDKRDSLAISLMKAIKITDSINTPFPDTIRLVTIEHFKRLGLEPSDYYTTKEFSVDKSNTLGEINSFRIQSRNDFKSLDNSDVSEDSWLIAQSKNINKVENFWIIEFYRIGALRDRCFNKDYDKEGLERIGAYGKEGDDILVYYNSSFSKILKIANAE